MEKLLNNYKISFTKGDTYALAVKLKNITDDLDSAYFTVKENADDSPLIQKSLGAGVSKIDDRAYKNEKSYKIQLQSEDTANLEPLVQYLYDFRVAIGNVVQTLLSGVFVVQHNISNVTTTSTTTLEVEIADTIESYVETTPATSGIEYEQDPVAMAKIGTMSELTTTAKNTLVGAVNEVKSGVNDNANKLGKILNGTTSVPQATAADEATHATTADTAENAGKVNDIAFNMTNGILKSNDDNVVVQRKKIWSGSVTTTAISGGGYVGTIEFTEGTLDVNSRYEAIYKVEGSERTYRANFFDNTNILHHIGVNSEGLLIEEIVFAVNASSIQFGRCIKNQQSSNSYTTSYKNVTVTEIFQIID